MKPTHPTPFTHIILPEEPIADPEAYYESVATTLHRLPPQFQRLVITSNGGDPLLNAHLTSVLGVIHRKQVEERRPIRPWAHVTVCSLGYGLHQPDVRLALGVGVNELTIHRFDHDTLEELTKLSGHNLNCSLNGIGVALSLPFDGSKSLDELIDFSRSNNFKLLELRVPTDDVVEHSRQFVEMARFTTLGSYKERGHMHFQQVPAKQGSREGFMLRWAHALTEPALDVSAVCLPDGRWTITEAELAELISEAPAAEACPPANCAACKLACDARVHEQPVSPEA